MAPARLGLAMLAASALSLLAGAPALSATMHARHHARHASHHVGRHTYRRAHLHAHHHSSAAASGTCTNSELRPSRDDLALIRTATLCLVNRERTARGELALQANARLEAAAQAHTESMAFGDYFEHAGPGGQTLMDRMRSSGYIHSSRVGFAVGENIAWGTGELASPRAIVAAWMASPGHRANILDGHFRDTAIGVSPHPPTSLAHGASGGIYTQDFGVITHG
jgi:uncharacterized protein YkwD